MRELGSEQPADDLVVDVNLAVVQLLGGHPTRLRGQPLCDSSEYRA
jgi:hypothetical protein